MSYTRVNWQNKPSTATPINATNLNTMDAGIAALDTAIGTLETAVQGKVDKVEGKGLSTNDFTDADALKLAGIEDGAEVNVQADWDEEDNTADDYIKNKPDLSVYAEKDALWKDATASGNPVTIKTQSAQAAKQTVITMLPIQSGSGTPSPDNVRPISGRTDVSVIVKDSDDVTQSTITIDLGQNVYGGTLDVETGELTIDTQRVELDTLNWSASSAPIVFFADDDLGEYIGNGKTIVACDSYASADNVSGLGGARSNPNGSICGFSGSGSHRIYLRDDSYSDAATLISALDGVYACYKLATPTTATLTAAQVALIKGINKISTDADSLSIIFMNDTIKISDVLGDFATIEAYNASQNYSIGDYLVFDGKFCKASVAIATGEALAIGTNLTQTTIGAELKAILAQL